MPLSSCICSCRTPALLLATAAIALLQRPPSVGALDDGLALTPPLAFNTWNCYYAGAVEGGDERSHSGQLGQQPGGPWPMLTAHSSAGHQPLLPQT